MVMSILALLAWARRRGIRLARRAYDETGSTMIEMALSSAMLALVMTSVLGFMTSSASNERFQQARVENQESVRLVMTQVAKDLRNANPLLPLADSTSFASSFEVALGPTEGPLSYARWNLVGTDLVRSSLSGPNGTVLSSGVKLSGISAWSLKYFDRNDVEITAADLPGDFVNCTSRVVISIASQTNEDAKGFVEYHDVQLRNHLLTEEESIGC